MSKSEIQQKIKEKARDMYDITDIFGKNLTKAVKLDDILKVLEGYVIIPKDVTDSDAFQIILNTGMKAPHSPFVVIPQQKMTELEVLIKDAPITPEQKLWHELLIDAFTELTEQREK